MVDGFLAGVFVAVSPRLFTARARATQTLDAVDVGLFDQHRLAGRIGGRRRGDGFGLDGGEFTGTDRGFGLG